jgi:putative glutamine amidotransferase
VLGICRGCQLINVALGGTLYQDIPTQVGRAVAHRDVDLYERALHDVTLVPGSVLAGLYPGVARAKINSIHHQAVKDLGRDLVVEALGETDGIVEAIRWRGPSYVFGIQWHPEFLALHPADASLLDGAPIRNEFMACAHERRVRPGAPPQAANPDELES